MKMKKLMWVLTAVYFVLLVSVLFVSRNELPEADVPLKDYVKTHVNFIPFSTIGELFGRLKKGTINLDVVIKNLIGNLLLFVPLGFIYPFFAKKAMKFGRFLCASLFTIVVAEILQLIFKCGILDVDDVFLNLIGAVLGFLAFAFIKHLLAKINMRNETQS